MCSEAYRRGVASGDRNLATGIHRLRTVCASCAAAPARGGFVALALTALVLALAAFTVPAPARADSLDDALANNRVATVSPSGTTINLFDYWITAKDDPDNVGGAGRTGDTGINQDHLLRFTDGQTDVGLDGSNNINRWTGHAGGSGYESKAGPNYGLVENTLVNGYPKLWEYDGGKTLHPYAIVRRSGSLDETLKREWGRVWTGDDQSLAYLFDSSTQDGKEAHLGVKGLLQYQNGYYVYNSKKNYAAYNASTNSFDVYDAAGVTGSGSGVGNNGMFFPFDAGREVFKESGNGGIVTNGTDQYAENLNHYFGLTMRTRFMQPADGKVEDDSGAEQDMTYHFSGDDDVWVYIDNVLVGDVGGIHDEATLDINFASGRVTIKDKNGTVEQETTLKTLFQTALGDDFNADKFAGDTFSEGTIHTLNFFYLERGNSASNLSLEFNLMEVPESSIIKVDQDGNPVEGATFELYRATADYQQVGAALASGTTDANGNLTLVGENGPISFDDLYSAEDKNGTTHYLLKETVVPKGYRSAVADQGGMKLLYTPVENGVGVITDAGGTDSAGYIWQNGSHVMPGETITTSGTLRYQSDNSEIPDADLNGGTLFAVVMKRTSSDAIDKAQGWQSMYGDAVNGYSVTEKTGKEGAIDAVQQDANPQIFKQGKAGVYAVTLDELPGDVMSYYWMLAQQGKQTDDAQYAVAVYLTTAGSVKDATVDNTKQVNSDSFTRQFFAKIYVANIQNKLFVQKVDDSGNGMTGATFSLYTADQVETDANTGKLVLKQGATAYDTVTTTDMAKPAIAGGAEFPTTRSKPLVENTMYYLKETSAPSDGYLVNDTLVPVAVDKTGVHAYAGNGSAGGADAGDDDGVSVRVGVGQLVKTLAQYGTNDGVDATLHNVKAILETSGQSVDAVASALQAGTGIADWTTTAFPSADAETYKDLRILHLAYGNAAPGQPVYEYGPSNNSRLQVDGANRNVSVTYDSGWGMMRVEQDTLFGREAVAQYKQEHPYSNPAYAELLKDGAALDITPLFSGSTTVVVANKALPRLEVTKQVEVPTAVSGEVTGGEAFPFTITITPKDMAKVPADGYPVRVYDAAAADGTRDEVKNADFTVTVNSAATDTAAVGTVTIAGTLKAGQTVQVLALATGDTYTVSEPGATMPAGFSLKGVADGDNKAVMVERTDGAGAVTNKVSGTVAQLGANNAMPSQNRLTYTNTVVGVRIHKVNADGEKGSDGAYPALGGATFSLRADKDGAPGDAVAVLAPTNGSGSTDDTTGNLDFIGLVPGTYWIVEDKAPAGFVAGEPVRIRVVADDADDADDAGSAAGLKVVRVNADGSTTDVPVGAGDAEGIAVMTIENHGMVELPQTGSSARPLLYLAAFLVLGAAGFFLARAWEGGRR